jgi:hypothetical protein
MKTGKRPVEGNSIAGLKLSPFRIPCFPIEWLDGKSWRLPSGKALAEFALQTGFIAPLLMKATVFGGLPPKPVGKRAAHAVAPRESR